MKLIPNTLHYGDCLEVMRQWPDGCVDLIYLDPPFNSNANYNILFGKGKVKRMDAVNRDSLAQLIAFEDMWEWSEKTARRIEEIGKAAAHPARDAVLSLNAFYKNGGGMLTYLVYMADRIAEMRRLLKPTGSIYLHCDPVASHYLKMILDGVFGANNFQNEIVWAYRTGGASKTRFARKHDIIFLYGKGEPRTFNLPKEKAYTRSESRKAGAVNYGGGTAEFYEDENGVYNLVNMRDVWDIPYIGSTDKERLGYPTQKPLALLERIVSASSNAGDVVLDPFCGCGTTIEAAMNLNRQFIGIDISMYALNVIQKQRLKDARFKIDGIPADMQSARAMAEANPFAFEKWAVHLIPGFVANNKQRGDGGVDGWGCLLHAPENEEGICMAQVKGGAPSADALRAFTSRLAGGSASLGVFITLEKCDTPTARQCIADAGTFKLGANQYSRMLMWSIEEYFAGAMPPLPPLANPVTGKAIQEDIMTRG
ncbi:MAG: DNA methyltransferase [Gammaproteobacteria bacterium]|nr:DNA methyltransferase [Gammaproteobacteria bacterium]